MAIAGLSVLAGLCRRIAAQLAVPALRALAELPVGARKAIARQIRRSRQPPPPGPGEERR